MANKEIDRKIAVIFATDVVGYSKHMEYNETETIKSLKICEEILRSLFKKHQGRMFATGGDSFLAEFTSAVAAVNCAVEFQEEIQKKNKNDGEILNLQFRIGINSGDVAIDGNNLLGDGVNIAARLEALALPDGITISKVVHDFVQGKTDHKFQDLGVQQIKSNKFHAYDLLSEATAKRFSQKKFLNFPIIAFTSATLLIALSLAYFLFNMRSISDDTKIGQENILLVMPFTSISKEEEYAYITDSMLDFFVSALSGYDNLKILSKNTSNLVSKDYLNLDEIQDRYSVTHTLSGTVTISEENMRTNISLKDIKEDSVEVSSLRNTKTNDLFSVQDEFAIQTLQYFGIAAKERRSSYSDVTNLEELRLLHLASLEREKWSKNSFPVYENAVEQLYKLNPQGYSNNLTKAWKFHYKMRLGLCKIEDDQKNIGPTSCITKALKFAETAIEIDPNSADAYLAKGYFLATLYLLNRTTDRTLEWGGLERAALFAEKGYNLIENDPYQFGMAGEVFTLSNEFERGSLSFARLFELDNNPSNTFTTFYMIASFLNKDYPKVKELALHIISKEEVFNKKDIGYAYIFLIYATNFDNDEIMLKKYLKAFRELKEPYSREMWTSWGNPFNGVWPIEAGKITQVMDNLGWFQ